MCSHHNIVLDLCGTSTCADCCVHFDKSLCSEFTTNYNGKVLNLLKTKSTIINTLEKDFGVCDSNTTLVTEKIFKLTSKNKMVKGTNKRSILCASLYYAYHYLEEPKNFEDMLIKFKINHKNGSKGLKMCQIAMQECGTEDEIKFFKIHSFASTHKEKLQELITRYNIPNQYYNEIEKIIIAGHLKRGKILNDRITGLWISCIFFWLIKINPYIDPEEFISINSDYSTLTQLKSDLTYLNKNLN
ncbi:hypothetical protein WIV_gp037 [Wiseana iridescent virus]|uniref:Uncharacterized protein n=1 Tax=Wiseana iridescent virus TaxID=68347 RepID=G0T563_IRV9|nr:hypothetical protein WIV_gp037 [Wiseana iridescent virus]ADO00380.1 hypothetical protein [Wiseana iridescent virus]